MKTIRVSLWGQLKLLAQTDSVNLALSEPCTVENAVRNLADTHAALKALLIGDDGACRQSILVFINGTQWAWGSESSLDEGAEMTLMSPIAGG